jgi:hypothetical protein
MNQATPEDYLREEATNDLDARKIAAKFQPSTGCWIDDHWGHYGVTRLIEIAQDYGFYLDECELLSVYAYRKDQTTFKHCGIESHTDDWIFDIGDAAEEWLNENVALPGHTFGWSEGEFFLMEDCWWNQDCDERLSEGDY